jgi:hypothetical protein
MRIVMMAISWGYMSQAIRLAERSINYPQGDPHIWSQAFNVVLPKSPFYLIRFMKSSSYARSLVQDKSREMHLSRDYKIQRKGDVFPNNRQNMG